VDSEIEAAHALLGRQSLTWRRPLGPRPSRPLFRRPGAALRAGAAPIYWKSGRDGRGPRERRSYAPLATPLSAPKLHWLLGCDCAREAGELKGRLSGDRRRRRPSGPPL